MFLYKIIGIILKCLCLIHIERYTCYIIIFLIVCVCVLLPFEGEIN